MTVDGRRGSALGVCAAALLAASPGLAETSTTKSQASEVIRLAQAPQPDGDPRKRNQGGAERKPQGGQPGGAQRGQGGGPPRGQGGPPPGQPRSGAAPGMQRSGPPPSQSRTAPPPNTAVRSAPGVGGQRPPASVPANDARQRAMDAVRTRQAPPPAGRPPQSQQPVGGRNILPPPGQPVTADHIRQLDAARKQGTVNRFQRPPNTNPPPPNTPPPLTNSRSGVVGGAGRTRDIPRGPNAIPRDSRTLGTVGRPPRDIPRGPNSIPPAWTRNGRPGGPPVSYDNRPRDNRWRNRAIVGGAVVGGAAILGAIALDKARADSERRQRDRYYSFDDVRSGRREVSRDGYTYIMEPDHRRIIRTDRGLSIRYDESRWLDRMYREKARVQRRRDGTVVTIFNRPGGIEIISITDGNGRLLRRVRRYRDGREIVLIDVGERYWPRPGYRVPSYAYLDIAPPEVRIPRERYIVDYRDASYEDIYGALSAPPVSDLDRGYSLEEIRDTRALREYMPRIDLDLITFDFGRYAITPDQYDRLDRIARAIRKILESSPDEVFLIEGHTDAVGDKEDNLSLSDRRAEEVARVLIEGYGIPAENLVTQGYGEQFLKVRTSEAERANRRVALLRITPLLARGGGGDGDEDRDPRARDGDDEDRGPRDRRSDDEDDDSRPRNSGPVGPRRN